MTSPDSGNRPEMVEAARKFMLTPKVRGTPFEEQRQFLVNKGVTESEIAEARSSLPPDALSPSNHPSNEHYMPPPPPPQNKLVSITQSAVLIGAVSYAGYRFVRSFVLPKFFDIPDPATKELRELQAQVNELQNSIKFVMDSVSQTTQTLVMQQQEMNRAMASVNNRDVDMSRVESGISAIKSLLLGHNNFAPILTPAANALPSWQQASSPTSSSAPIANAGGVPPSNSSANRVEGVDEVEDDEFEDSRSGDGRVSPV